MILIIGLGNPGKKLAKTRHNVGFMILDSFKRKGRFSQWQTKKQFKAKICQKRMAGKKIILAKPQTFMNDSGLAAKLFVSYYKLPIKNVFVVHDDLALPLSKLKISQARGAAGHKGVQSIINQLAAKNFIRLRVGINHETHNMEHGTKKEIKSDFVLKKFTKEEEKIFKRTKKRACEALSMAIKEGKDKAMNQFN